MVPLGSVLYRHGVDVTVKLQTGTGAVALDAADYVAVLIHMYTIKAVCLKEFLQTGNHLILVTAVTGCLNEFLAKGDYIVLLFLSKHSLILLIAV